MVLLFTHPILILSAIIASNSGNLRIVDLRNREIIKVSCRSSVEKMEIIVDPEETFKVRYLL